MSADHVRGQYPLSKQQRLLFEHLPIRLSRAPVPGAKALADSAATASREGTSVPATAQTSAPAVASGQQGAGGKPPPAPPTRAYQGPPMQKLKLKLRMKPAAAAAPP